MNVFVDNFWWMLFNLYLAILPVIFCWLLLKFKNKFLKLIFCALWLLYLPNSIYVITDTIHFFRQVGYVPGLEKILLLFQFIIFEGIGLLAFLLAVYPVEKKLRTFRYTSSFLIILNFFVGFAIVFGRIDRINSWEVFTAPVKVIQSIVHVSTSFELVMLALLFGLFTNFFYFLFRKKLDRYTSF